MDHQFFFNGAKNHSAQNCAPNGPNPAYNRHKKNGNSGREGKYVAWIKECSAPRVDTTSDASETGCNGMNP